MYFIHGPPVFSILGNEETRPDYWDAAQPILVAMRSRCAALHTEGKAARGQDLTGLRWSIMYCAWGVRPATAATCNTTIKLRIADDTAAISSSVLWDQHDSSNKLAFPDAQFQRHDSMVAMLRGRGWTQDAPLIIGETNCGPVPEAVCSSLNRALVYSLFISDAARKGYVASVMPAVWAYAACDAAGMVCGGDDGGTAWPVKPAPPFPAPRRCPGTLPDSVTRMTKRTLPSTSWERANPAWRLED